MTSTLKAIERAIAKNRVNPQRARPSYSAESQNTAYLRCGAKSAFGIMGVGPKESNSRGDALIENGNTGYRPTEQLLGCGQNPRRGESQLQESVGSCRNEFGGRLRDEGNARRLGAHHDRRCGRNDSRPSLGDKEIATPPEVATYQKYTKPLPSASRGFGAPFTTLLTSDV